MPDRSMHLFARDALLEAGRPDLAERVLENEDDPAGNLVVVFVSAHADTDEDRLLLHRAVRVAQLACGDVDLTVCAACYVALEYYNPATGGACRGVPPSLEHTDCGAERLRLLTVRLPR